MKRISSSMNRMTMAILLSACSFCFQVRAGIAYYIKNGGSDALSGHTPDSAWATIAKVNGETFAAGDTIYLRSGSSWTVSQRQPLNPKGSGTSGNPIVIGMYGGIVKPLINGNGITGQGAVYLNNQQYWEISNLEITNDAASAGDRRGLLVAASNFGIVHHIYLRNLDIHNVKGRVGDGDTEKRTAGIGIETTNDDTLATRYDDILIEGCTISWIENTGLYTDNLVVRNDYPNTSGWSERRFTNVRIRNNVIHHISKNAMIIRLLDRGVIEHNVCYETATGTTGNTMFTAACNGTVFQYNEGYLNRGGYVTNGGDGSMYDADLRSPNTVFQFSYSHDNAHGLFWTCTVQQDSGVVCRYNVSQNDKGIIFCINFPNTSVYCYNNTVYCGSSVSPIIISERNVNTGTRKYLFHNNIIYNNSASATYDFRSSSLGYTRTIDYNVFYGNHPATEPSDAHKSIADPRLVNPGSGSIGIGTVDGYRLQASSPCIDSGILLFNHSVSDFLRGLVPSGSAVDRGACEYQLPLPIQLASFTATMLSNGQVRLNWATLTELNNYGFEVQKSADTPANYQTISNSFTPGHGTTVVPQYYAFADFNATPGHWYYRLKQIDLDGTVHHLDATHIDILTGAGEKGTVPAAYEVSQNYPNPFNPSTRIKYQLPIQSYVTLKIYDALGREVATLANNLEGPGYKSVEWDASGVSSGAYFYRLEAGSFTNVKRLLLLR